MHIWILKYSDNNFSTDFIAKANDLAENINQLKNRKCWQKSYGKFHLLSFTTQFDYSQKVYLQETEKSTVAYSGLLIGKETAETDLRDIKNIEINRPEKYNGQFALFELTENSFSCLADNFGFHKVFYGQIDNEIYVSNSLDFLKKLNKIKVNSDKLILDFLTVRFGVYPGNDTVFEDFYTLPEYGRLNIINGQLTVDTYKPISDLLVPNGDFESKLQETIADFKMAANYLRKYHHTVVPLSGGFDGRTILSYFYKTEGKPLETMTYNRAGKLDFYIAARLSKAFKVPHRKIHISKSIVDFEAKIPEVKKIDDDPFNKAFSESIKVFYNQGTCFKVSLGGNGADTDWEFGEKQLKKLDQSNFNAFIKSYSTLITQHPYVNKQVSERLATKMENYFIEKYHVFQDKSNFMQLLASSFFHLERFRSEQGSVCSQFLNKKYDTFMPYATESLNQTVFLATKKQLNRGVKEGINYRIYEAMTEGKMPYAPILTANNEFGKNFLQKSLNRIFPYLPKIIWKLNNGDTNGNIRKQYSAKITTLSNEYILKSIENDIWNYLDASKIKDAIQQPNYNGSLNEVAKMLKFVDDINKKSN